MQRVANADVMHEVDRSFIVLNFQIRNMTAFVLCILRSIIRKIITYYLH